MKKLFSVVLCVLLTLSLIPAAFTASAADARLMDGATLVTFGDSITALSTWPQSVAQSLNMKLVNSGIGGNTTAHGLARFERDVAAHDPDFVIMAFGSNDFNREDNGSPRLDLASYKANLQTFVDNVKALGAEPILMTPPFISPSAAGGASLYPEGSVNAGLDTYVNAMREIADVNGVGLIDMHAVCDSGYSVSSFLISDGVHLSSQGNSVYTDTIVNFMKSNYRSDASAPRVEYPTAPEAEPGVWTKDIAPTDLDEWLIIYPDTMYGVQEADGSVSFANTNGMWPEVHYSPSIDKGITVPVKGSYLTIDMEFEAGSNVVLFFNGPNPTLAYANTYISLTDALKAKIPTLQTSYSDILGGQSVYTTLALEDIVPSSFIASDGTVVFTGVKIFVVGDAHKKVTLKELSVTTTDGSTVDPAPSEYTDVESLLPTDVSQLSQVDGKVDYTIHTDGSLKLVRSADSAIEWPSVKVVSGKTINLSETPYLHMDMHHSGGWANGILYYTNAYGTSGSIQLSQLFDGSVYDFCTADHVYADLAKALGTTGVITLDYYTLSVYGVGGDAVTWYTLSLAKEKEDEPALKGDVNGSGTVDTSDATAILRHFNGTKLLDDAAVAIADCNGDGKLNTSDVRYILKALVA